MRRTFAHLVGGLFVVAVAAGAGVGCAGNNGAGTAPTGSGGSPAGGAPGSGGAGTAGAPGSGGGTSGGAVGSGGGATGGSGAGTGGTASGGAGGGTAGRGSAGNGAASGGKNGNGGNGGNGGGSSGGNGNGGGGATPAGGAGGGNGSPHWVGTWTGAPQLTETANLPPASLAGSVLRQVIRVSLGGTQLRVRFSNEFGNGPLTINAAHIAVCKANPVDSTIDTATDKALAFAGMAAVTIAEGKSVWSDPVDFTLGALSNLTVTTAFGAVPSNVTGHPGSRTTSYQQAASTTLNAANMSSAQKADHWYVLSGVDVMADAAARGVVILGDSITDGKGSTTNANNRWPDLLAKRLQANAATAKVAVMNQGIGGNNVTTDGLGPPASMRYMRDVLGQSGVRWVIIYEGVNDVGTDVAAGPVTTVFDQIIAQAHAQGLLVYGATITPFAGHSYYTVARETQRQSVNTYVRGTKFDAFIDFDAAVRDTSTPPKLQASYDSGDGLHLTPTGYQKMADTVDLTLFTR